MQLYLVQHGEAKPEHEDPQRGLTEQGRATVEQVARFLEPLKLTPRLIEHSDKLRARQTAEILAARLYPPQGTRQVAGIAPNDPVQSMLERLKQETETLMIVGHLPYLSRLVSGLLGLPLDHLAVRFRMGGIVRLGRDENGQWAIEWAIPPEAIGWPTK
jgi:phosphohistidine phosphatase